MHPLKRPLSNTRSTLIAFGLVITALFLLLFVIYTSPFQNDFIVESAALPNAGDDCGNSASPDGETLYIGNPFKSWFDSSPENRYARNVWDMQLWGDKIYLGYGNSSNIGPAPNAGPVHVVSYHLQSGCFKIEFTVDEEQIDRYRVIGGQLYIPGHDPLDPWEFGNFYRLEEDEWVKIRSIPLGIHTYDIYGYQSSLFAALGTIQGGVVARSSDGGETWESFPLLGADRAFELFELGNELYVHAYHDSGLYRYNGAGFYRLQVDPFPSAQYGSNPMMVRTILFNDTLLYIGADNTNDHQWVPFGAYKATQINAAQKLNLPARDLPYDILVRDGMAYILANRVEAASNTVIVYRSDDLSASPENWQEVVSFDTPSIARSFELHEGNFYVGLGTATDPLNQASGDIYLSCPNPPGGTRQPHNPSPRTYFAYFLPLVHVSCP